MEVVEVWNKKFYYNIKETIWFTVWIRKFGKKLNTAGKLEGISPKNELDTIY